MPDMMSIPDLEEKASNGERFSRRDAEQVLASADLVGIGRLGELARRKLSGDVITFGRVCGLVADAAWPDSCGPAGEVRLSGAMSSVDEAVALVVRARERAGRAPLTGFSVADLRDACGGDVHQLAASAERLRAGGLDAVAECPIDRLGDVDDAVAAVQALARGGLGVWRLTVDRAPAARSIDLAERAAAIQDRTGLVRAYAPLPRHLSGDLPSTGYDDVRTVAVTRLICMNIPHVQVDWPLYGPKLAQVALLYGANDIDGVAAIDAPALGPRRSSIEDIRRQIRAAAGVPVERNGRYERLP